ncbi:MAG TPA: malto-oligosyltrehalose trehalohydrolase [Streptosporangiaceae bacterium]|nr:malto-oligosyltrehalose trehalohydrolase [Streptosporangiaceae bacterium]
MRARPTGFTVWAPRADRVDLVADGRRLPMRRGERGWWLADLPEARPGTDYGFSLDGGPVRPDPRSGWQPDGVSGLSRRVDHDAFAWTDAGWRGLALPGAVLYECHVGTFSAAGTFDGAIGHLDHLAWLGVDAIELMPVAEFSGDRGWGYDGVALFAPHHAYGGPDGLKRLVNAAHDRGIGVILDVVYNHLGPAGNFLPEFGPYFAGQHQTNWGDGVNLDGPGSDEVRRFVIDNALSWLRDYHLDGLRLDAVHAIADDSATHLLEQLSAEVAALAAHLRRPLFLIAESDRNDPRYVRSRDAGGYGLDASWADEWHHALHAVLTGERDGYYSDFGSLAQLAKAIRQAWVYDGCYSPHRQRVHGRSPAGLAGNQFVVSVQNHDQIGNRAAGDRLTALTSAGRLKIAAALMLTSPFVPMLFQGEEWGAETPFQYFTDHADPALGRAVSDGRRLEFAAFGWEPADVPDPQDFRTFGRSRLDWAESSAGWHAELLAWYRKLIGLRREIQALGDPRLDQVSVDFVERGGWLVVRRGRITVASNLGVVAWTFRMRTGTTVLATSDLSVSEAPGGIELPPDTVAILAEQPSTSQANGLASLQHHAATRGAHAN